MPEFGQVSDYLDEVGLLATGNALPWKTWNDF